MMEKLDIAGKHTGKIKVESIAEDLENTWNKFAVRLREKVICIVSVAKPHI